jgi:hypothetical protein
VLEKEVYLEKKNSLIKEEKAVGERLRQLEQDGKRILAQVEKFLELVNSAYESYKLATAEERRELVGMITSNLTVEGKNLIVKLNYPFELVVDRLTVIDGGPQRDVTRTLSALLSQLCDHFRNNELAVPKTSASNLLSRGVSLTRAA